MGSTASLAPRARKRIVKTARRRRAANLPTQCSIAENHLSPRRGVTNAMTIASSERPNSTISRSIGSPSGGHLRGHWIRRKFGRIVVRLEQPNLAIVKIAEQLRILVSAHAARPHDSGVVDVGGIVNPFVKRPVIAAVVHNHELASRELFKPGLKALPSDAGRRRLVPGGGVTRRQRNVQRPSHRAQDEHDRADCRDRAYYEESGGTAVPAPALQSAHGEND